MSDAMPTPNVRGSASVGVTPQRTALQTTSTQATQRVAPGQTRMPPMPQRRMSPYGAFPEGPVGVPSDSLPSPRESAIQAMLVAAVPAICAAPEKAAQIGQAIATAVAQLWQRPWHPTTQVDASEAPMNHVPSPDTSDAGIERLIQAKGKTAPRITPADVEANIASEHYFTAADGVRGALLSSSPELGIEIAEDDPRSLLTFCVLILRNGLTCVGTSACASPENFDAQIGRQIARQKALDDVWKVMGYELRTKLAGGA